jgi:6-phosphogluconolactonase (cycloisomerase 2 family)
MGGMHIYARDLATGALSPLGFLQQGVGGVDGLAGPTYIAISGDGAHVYVSAYHSLAHFTRDAPTGALTFEEVEVDDVGGVDGLRAAEFVTISPDGNHVYVAGSNDDAIAVFARDSGTGALTFRGVVRDGVGGVTGLSRVRTLSLSPDGAYLYAVGTGFGGALTVFQRDAMTGALTFVEAVVDGSGGVEDMYEPALVVATTTDVYVGAAGDEAIVRFARDASTGVVTFQGSIRNGASGVTGLAFSVDATMVVSPDEKYLYVNADYDNMVTVVRPLAVACSAVPLSGCLQPAVAGKARLDLRPGATPRANRLVWQWKLGAATAPGDIGDPAGTPNDYALCVYDQSAAPQPLLAAVAPALTFCDETACWKAGKNGRFGYRDGRATPDGLRRISLVPGAAAKAKVTVKGQGEFLGVPALPLTPRVTVQLQTAAGPCWEARYDAATRNDAERFQALAN